MSGTTLGLLIVMIVYLAGMIVIGAMYSRTNKSIGDFYLGGRKLGPFVTAMSAEASDMSSWLLMGLPGVAYLTGCAEAVWTAVGLAIGTYLSWKIMAGRLRRYSAKVDAITIPDFFANRFHDKSHSLECIAAIIIVVFFVPYTASGFSACGKLFSSLFGIDYLTAMIISAVIIFSYTALGGFLAASTTDLIQSIVMSLALITVVIFGVNMAGGLGAVISNAEAIPGYLSVTFIHEVETNSAQPYSVLTIASLLAWGLGYFGMPHFLLRFMGIKDEKKIPMSRRIATTWVCIAMGVAIFIGIIGNAMSANGSIGVLEGSSEAETLLVQVANMLSQYGFIFMILGGVILAGILACTMSTADSQLLAASSSISKNLLVDTFGLKISERTQMILARVTVIGIAVVAVFMASDPDSSVFRIVSFAWAGFGGSFSAVMLFSLFWKRMNRNGALAGMIVGGVMVFVWKYLIAPMGGVWGIYELLPAFLCSCLAIVVVSLATKAPDKEITDEFESYYKEQAS